MDTQSANNYATINVMRFLARLRRNAHLAIEHSDQSPSRCFIDPRPKHFASPKETDLNYMVRGWNPFLPRPVCSLNQYEPKKGQLHFPQKDSRIRPRRQLPRASFYLCPWSDDDFFFRVAGKIERSVACKQTDTKESAKGLKSMRRRGSSDSLPWT